MVANADPKLDTIRLQREDAAPTSWIRRQFQLRPLPGIRFIGQRHHRVDAVIAPVQVNHHQHTSVTTHVRVTAQRLSEKTGYRRRQRDQRRTVLEAREVRLVELGQQQVLRRAEHVRGTIEEVRVAGQPIARLERRPQVRLVVPPTDAARRAELEVRGFGRVTITVRLPSWMISAEGHRLPLRFAPGDGMYGFLRGQREKGFDPTSPLNLVIPRGQGGIRLFFGGTARPAQRAGRRERRTPEGVAAPPERGARAHAPGAEAVTEACGNARVAARPTGSRRHRMPAW